MFPEYRRVGPNGLYIPDKQVTLSISALTEFLTTKEKTLVGFNHQGKRIYAEWEDPYIRLECMKFLKLEFIAEYNNILTNKKGKHESKTEIAEDRP